MKIFKYSIIILLCCLSGCSKFLDIVPDNVATLENAFTMRNTAERYLFTCYSYMPALGSITSDPAMLAGGDIWPLYRSTISGAQYARGLQNVTSPYLNYWDGARDGTSLFKGIRDCNIFLDNIQNVPDMDQDEKDKWSAEVKFLKAFYHFYLFRMYGPIPIIKENLPIDAGLEEVRVERKPVDEVVDYIVELLDEASDALPLEIYDEASELGRITKPIALTLKSYVLLTAASPLFNGNKDYPGFKDSEDRLLFNPEENQEKWRKAAAAAKEAIELCHSLGIKLWEFPLQTRPGISDTTWKQLSIRTAVTQKWNDEIIWTLTDRNVNQATLTPRTWDPDRNHNSMQGRYGPSINYINLYYTDNGVPINEDLTWDYANRYELKQADEEHKYNIKKGYTTVKYHFNRENRFYASVGFDGGIWYGQGKFDDKDTWHLEGKAGQYTSRQVADRYTPTGYWPKKLINYLNVIGASSYSSTHYYWPVFRLAELYLMYAEALNEFEGPGPEVYKYLNMIRERAGLKTIEESWENYSRFPSKYKEREGLREIIHQERQIELGMEGKRLWDLLRWKTAHDELNKPVLGWDLPQVDANLYYRETIVFNREFKQRDYFWPVRESSVITNRKILQSPGW